MKFPNKETYFLEQDASFEYWQTEVIRYQKRFSKQPENTWLLFEQDSYLFSILFFALLTANKKIVLPQNGQVLQIEQSMQHADIFVGSQPSEKIPHFDLTPRSQADYSSTSNKADSVREIEFSQDSQIIFFTSGSSGTPKAVSKTIGQLLLEVDTLERTFCDLNCNSFESIVFMSTVSHQHIYGLLFKLLWPIWMGHDVYLKTFQYPEHLVHKIKQYPNKRIQLISSPAYYHRLVNDNLLIQIKSQLNALFSSGGPLKNDVALQILSELDQAPYEVFGSTETGGIAWRKTESHTDDYWQLFENIKCRIEDKTDRLSILSPYTSYDQKNVNNEWFVTDDRAEMIQNNLQDKNQRFKLLGRADRIVKIEEKRCSLDEIQTKLVEHEWIKQVYVLTTGGTKGKRLSTAAIIELSDSGKKTLETSTKFKFDQQLKSYLKGYFEPIVVPRKFRHIKNLPFNSQGKLNKLQLEALFD